MNTTAHEWDGQPILVTDPETQLRVGDIIADLEQMYNYQVFNGLYMSYWWGDGYYPKGMEDSEEYEPQQLMDEGKWHIIHRQPEMWDVRDDGTVPEDLPKVGQGMLLSEFSEKCKGALVEYWNLGEAKEPEPEEPDMHINPVRFTREDLLEMATNIRDCAAKDDGRDLTEWEVAEMQLLLDEVEQRDRVEEMMAAPKQPEPEEKPEDLGLFLIIDSRRYVLEQWPHLNVRAEAEEGTFTLRISHPEVNGGEYGEYETPYESVIPDWLTGCAWDFCGGNPDWLVGK